MTVITDKPLFGAPRVFGWMDLAVAGLLAALIYGVVTVAREGSGPLQQVPEIHLETRYLPLYALFSLTRMSWWERFVRLALSFAPSGLLWNSMRSMADGWFFLMVRESFVLTLCIGFVGDEMGKPPTED